MFFVGNLQIVPRGTCVAENSFHILFKVNVTGLFIGAALVNLRILFPGAVTEVLSRK